MNCEEFANQLEDLASHDPRVTLPPELHEHQLGCESCRELFFDTQQAWLLLAAALDPEPVRPDVEVHLMQKLSRSQQRVVKSLPRMALVQRYLVAASVLAALVVATVLSPNWFGLQRETERELQQVRELARQMDKIKDLETVFGKPRIRFVSLTSATRQNRVNGYLVYDFAAGEAHFFGLDLPSSDAQDIVLWMLDTHDTVLGSTAVEVTADGLGGAIIKLPTDPTLIEKVVVSAETDPSPAAPSSSTFIRSQVAW